MKSQNRAGGGGGLAGPFQTLRVPCESRGRVAEWPVTDPILRYWYCLKTTRWPNQLPVRVRRSGAGAGRFDRTRPAAERRLARQRQGDRLAGRRGVFDCESHFQGSACFTRRCQCARLADREMIQPGARLGRDRSPEISQRPVARSAALQEHHVDRLVGKKQQKVGAGDVIHVPRGAAYRWAVRKGGAARYAAVRSTPRLEAAIRKNGAADNWRG